MQGTYRNNGLPRPYYMKPSKKKSPYENINSVNFFNTSRRKILGYLVMLFLFGTCMMWVAQELRPGNDPQYEIVKSELKQPVVPEVPSNKLPNIEKIANSVGSKADKESRNVDLAGNFAQGSKGEKGLGVVEAPKGGIANEAPMVGNDEDKLVGTGKNIKPKGQVSGQAPKYDTQPPKKGYKA
ncbi:uncharacterized protein CANTADRAFT_40983, partial [Suhomyces tanzawaensis NRRL Y-17324]